MWGLWGGALWLAVIFYDLTRWYAPDPALPLGVPTVAVGVLLGLGAWLWPYWQYRAWRFVLRPNELYLMHGVITHVRTVVPLRRIQHLDVSQNILEREFGLGRLVVHTAGSRSSDVTIPGLPLDDAERLRDQVRQFILDDPLPDNSL